MKIIVSADWHIHPWRICSNNGGYDRLLDALSALRQSLQVAREESAAWVMAGDFKQPKTYWPQEALTGAHAILREFSDVQKFMIPGNHDREGLGGSGLAPFQDCATVIDQATIVDIGLNHQMLFLPWNAPREAAQQMNKHHRLPIVAHAFLAGVLLGSDETRLPGMGIDLKQYGDFPVAFFGDIHKGQWLNRPRWVPYVNNQKTPQQIYSVREKGSWHGEVFYPGSPYQQNWGERGDGQKGVICADLDTGAVSFVPLKAPQFRHLEVDESGLEDWLPKLDRWEGDFLRVIYTGRPSAILNQLQNKKPLFRSLTVIPRRPPQTEIRVDIHAGMSRRQLMEQYMTARPPDPEIQDEIMKAWERLIA